MKLGEGRQWLKKISQALTEAYRRGLTDKEIENVRARVAGRGVDNLNQYFIKGGGNKAVSGGKTVDEVIDQGQRLVEGARRKAKAEKEERVRASLNRQSQVV